MRRDRESHVQDFAAETSAASTEQIAARTGLLVEGNRRIHECDCFNLNPAANVMNPNAEALLAQGLGSLPSRGYPCGKYEMGLEAIGQIGSIRR